MAETGLSYEQSKGLLLAHGSVRGAVDAHTSPRI
jgi:hypothetical protein